MKNVFFYLIINFLFFSQPIFAQEFSVNIKTKETKNLDEIQKSVWATNDFLVGKAVADSTQKTSDSVIVFIKKAEITLSKESYLQILDRKISLKEKEYKSPVNKDYWGYPNTGNRQTVPVQKQSTPPWSDKF
jgi:hypothetical protein